MDFSLVSLLIRGGFIGAMVMMLKMEGGSFRNLALL
jgi:hypothetical protein